MAANEASDVVFEDEAGTRALFFPCLCHRLQFLKGLFEQHVGGDGSGQRDVITSAPCDKSTLLPQRDGAKEEVCVWFGTSEPYACVHTCISIYKKIYIGGLWV